MTTSRRWRANRCSRSPTSSGCCITPRRPGDYRPRFAGADKTLDVTLDLPEGWRRGNISWRATTWDLRRMGLGGMVLKELSDEQREEAKLPKDAMALKVMHVGQYGDHAVAKKAGFQPGDIVTAYDHRSDRISESELLAYALQKKKPGDEVVVTVLRHGEEKVLRLPLQ